MRIEFRLKQILAAAHITLTDTQIGVETELDRRTVGNIRNNKSPTVDLATLEQICAWLQKRGCGEGLPGALLGFRSSPLLEAMVAPLRLKFWLGEYREKRPEGTVRARVSRDDTNVAARIIQLLCTLPGSRPQLSFEHGHVPLHVPSDGGDLDTTLIEKDCDEGRRAAEVLNREGKAMTNVLVGSPLANYLQECFVAGLFQAEPYVAPAKPLPLYLKFEERTRAPSCFGGEAPPPGAAAESPPGIYYRNRDERRWHSFPYVPKRRGTGIVIVQRHAQLKGLDLSIFGLTGICTAAMGKLLCDMPGSFWPAEGRRRIAPASVYVCGFDLDAMQDWEQDIESVNILNPQIVALEES